MNQRRTKLKTPKFRVKSVKCGGSNNPGRANPVDSNPPANPHVSGGTCLTVGGGKVGVKCVFPFTFLGRTYHGCTTTVVSNIFPMGSLWCSTRTDSRGLHLSKQNEWGHCNSECPVHLKNTTSYPSGSNPGWFPFVLRLFSCQLREKYNLCLILVLAAIWFPMWVNQLG